MYQDAHLHIQANTNLDIRPEIGRAFLNSTSSLDYSTVESAARKSSAVVPFFGLHPWMIDSKSFSEESLTRILNSNVSAGIGECGLDSTSKYRPQLEEQKRLFTLQLKIAVELERPVSIHCVHSWEDLFNCFDQLGPRTQPFILHSFYGSAEILSRLLRYGAYISISSRSLRNPDHSHPVISKVPIERILIETDMISGSPGFSAEIHLQELKNIYNVASSIFRISESEFISKVWENGTIFTN